MSGIATFSELVKTKKALRSNTHLGHAFNHPHRLESISVSGTVTYTRDERAFDPPHETTATRKVYSIDLAPLWDWTRLWQTKYGWQSADPPSDPGEAEFVLYHIPLWPWIMQQRRGDTPENVKIGTVTTTNYTWDDEEEDWIEGTTDAGVDVMGGFLVTLYGGGHPVSGGRGADDDDNSVVITVSGMLDGLFTTGGVSPGTPVQILRLPWDDPWTSESAAFSDMIADIITALNADNGGGHSATASVTLGFT